MAVTGVPSKASSAPSPAPTLTGKPSSAASDRPPRPPPGRCPLLLQLLLPAPSSPPGYSRLQTRSPRTQIKFPRHSDWPAPGVKSSPMPGGMGGPAPLLPQDSPAKVRFSGPSEALLALGPVDSRKACRSIQPVQVPVPGRRRPRVARPSTHAGLRQPLAPAGLPCPGPKPRSQEGGPGSSSAWQPQPPLSPTARPTPSFPAPTDIT